MFRILARPFDAVGADDGVSRRGECISTGRERPGSSPRGPGVILEIVFTNNCGTEPPEIRPPGLQNAPVGWEEARGVFSQLCEYHS